MSNLYDVFNKKKQGLESLVEGSTAVEEVEIDFDMEKPEAALESLMAEEGREFIALESAIYASEVVLENSMFEDFDADVLEEALKTNVKEKAGKLADRVKSFWSKIKAWFSKMAESVKTMFADGEAIVAKRGKEFAEKLGKTGVTAKVNVYADPSAALDKVTKLCYDAFDAGMIEQEANTAKTNILKAVGAKDMKDLKNVVAKLFITSAKGEEQVKLSTLNANIVMKYAGGKKVLLDAIEKIRVDVDKDFAEVLRYIEKDVDLAKTDSEKAGAQSAVKVFNFAINVKTNILNAAVATVKKAYSDNRAIMVKVLGGKEGKPEDGKEPTKESFAAIFDDIEFEA